MPPFSKSKAYNGSSFAILKLRVAKTHSDICLIEEIWLVWQGKVFRHEGAERGSGRNNRPVLKCEMEEIEYGLEFEAGW